tara:strand:+ start:1223 stop:1882 length:660 start_codon:yes stop_codon:yes gene_type:complete
MRTGLHEDELTEYVLDENIPKANNLLMRNLGKTIISNKSDFIDLLNENGIEADVSMPPGQLIELFINNTSNKDLLIGASLLIELNKRKIGFDGEHHVNDSNVKTGVAVMDSYFNDSVPQENYSYIAPFLIGALAKGAGKLRNRKRRSGKNKRSANDEMRKLAEFKMRQEALYRQKLELERQQKIAKEKKEKRKRTNTIIIASSLVVTLIVGIVVAKKYS